MDADAEEVLGSLLKLHAEASRKLAVPGKDGEILDRLAVARGHLELARDHGEPLNVAAVVEQLMWSAKSAGDWTWSNKFLSKLRRAEAFAKLGAF